MSTNWTIRDLASRLKKQYVLANQIMVGDVVIDDSACWQAVTIHKEPNGFLTILDEDGNGFMNVPPDDRYLIIHRGCFGP